MVCPLVSTSLLAMHWWLGCYLQCVDAFIEWQFLVYEYIDKPLKSFLKLGKAKLP